VLRGGGSMHKSSAYDNDDDNKTNQEFTDFLVSFTNCCQIVSKYQFINIQLLAGNKISLAEYWGQFKNRLVDIIIWDKILSQPAMAPCVLNSVFEFVFVFCSEDNPSRSIKSGKGFQSTEANVYRLSPHGKKDPLLTSHRAVFPLEFAEHFVTKFSKKSVLDPFGGSGTTMIASEKTGRKCFVMEIDPVYCDVIVARWEKFTGQKAVLETK
jgi:DNA modification methylase